MSPKTTAEIELRLALSTAVPLWIATWKETPWEVIAPQLPEWAQIIAEHGDQILYRSDKPGETAQRFNTLAKAVAALSFAAGGVTCFDEHWESRHPDVNYPTHTHPSEDVKPDDDSAAG